MRVVDTSAWVEWLSRSPVGMSVRPKFPDPDDWIVPTIVQLELVKWMARATTAETAERVLAFTTTCRVVPLDMRLAVAAAGASARHKLATADAVIYATAVSESADLLTCDAHFQNFPGVVFIPKRPPAP